MAANLDQVKVYLQKNFKKLKEYIITDSVMYVWVNKSLELNYG